MLSEKLIKGAKPKAQHFILWDEKVKGFGCRIFPKGQKSYVVMYRIQGRRVMATLARVEDMKLEEARTAATAELLKVRQGDVDLVTRRKANKDAPTFADLWQRFLDDYAKERLELGRLSKKTVSDYKKIAKKYLLPVLGLLRVHEIKRGDIERTARGAAKFPTQRNRTLALLSRLFSLSEEWELRPQHSNPCRGITRAREIARDRILAPSELQRLNAALLELEQRYPFETAAINVAAMTGLRISEALSMRWEHVNFEMARVILPITKTGKRIVPLARPVLALLAALPRLNGNQFVFASLYPRRGPCSVTYRSTRNVFSTASKSAGLQDVRLHDLRRSLATHLASAGVNAFILRDVLGHSSITMSNRYVQQANGALVDATEQAAAFISTAMEQRPNPEKKGV